MPCTFKMAPGTILCGLLSGLGSPPPLVSQELVTFHFQPAVAGQNIWQHLTMFANLTTTYEQSGQRVSQQSRLVTTEQIRRLRVVAAEPQAMTKVRVHYEKAQRTLRQRGLPAEIQPESVAGKSYVAWREGEQLEVTYDSGEIPPADELDIVRTNMQSVGRANPLVVFLNGRTLKLGQEVQLPPGLAAELLGWKQEFGALERVVLRLVGRREVAGLPCAVFDAEMSGTAADGTDTANRMQGEIVVQCDTCRTLSADMRAQLDTHQQRGPEGHTFAVHHRGSAQIHTQARFLEVNEDAAQP